MAARFWVGGTGTWDSAATTHWASTSGGASGASAPTAADSATFDGSSGLANGVTVTVASTAACSGLTITGPAAQTCVFSFSGNVTFGGSVTINGNSAVNRLLFQSDTVGTQRTVTITTLSALTNVDFMDIKGAGTASPFSGTKLGDCLGNAGITFTVAVTRYGVVAGNWSSTATWASSTGGAGGQSVPLPQDTVHLDANSAAGTYTIDVARWCKNLDCTGFTRTLALGAGTFATQQVFGDLTLVAGMTVTAAAVNVTLAGRSAQTLTTGGKDPVTASGTFNLKAFGGSYTLADALSTAGQLQFFNGTFDTAGFNVQCKAINQNTVNATRVLTLHGSRVTLTGTGTVWNGFIAAGVTYTANTATIIISDTSSTGKTFAAGGVLNLNGTSIQITGGGTGSVTFSGTLTGAAFTVGAPKTVVFPAAITTTVTSLSATGSSGNVITFQSSTPGTRWTLSCSSLVSCDWLSVTDGIASGITPFYAGANGSVSNTTHWVAEAPPAAALQSTSTLTATGSVLRTGVAPLSSTESLTASGKVLRNGAASLAAVDALSAAGSVTLAGAASLASAETVAATGSVIYAGMAGLSSAETVASRGNATYAAAASLASVKSLAAAAEVRRGGTASLSTSESLTATGSLAHHTVDGAAALSVSDTLTAGGSITFSGSASLGAGSALVVASSVTYQASAALSTNATLGAAAAVVYKAAVALAAGSRLTANGTSVRRWQEHQGQPWQTSPQSDWPERQGTAWRESRGTAWLEHQGATWG